MKYVLAVLVVALCALAAVPVVRYLGKADEPGRRSGPGEVHRSKAVKDAAADDIFAPPPRSEPVGDTIATIILDVARGKTSDADRAAQEERLRDILAIQELGAAPQQEDAATVTVEAIYTRARQAKSSGKDLGQLKLRAIKALAKDLAVELYRRLPSGGGLSHDPAAIRATAPEAAVPEGYIAATWQLIGGFEYSMGESLPDEVRGLDGKKVGITGYMVTLEEDDDISEFLLVQSLWDCCFGMPPGLHQGVVVRYEKPGLVFSTEPVQALGTFEVGEDTDADGFILSVYRLNASEVNKVR